jgi:hypothetical protein
MSNCYTVGFAKVDITPDKPTPYLAFNPRHTLFEGVHDPLYARVITVSDSKEQAVIIGTDTIGIANAVLGEDRNYTSEVRKKIAEKTGIPETSVMLASPHIHSAPETINLRPIKDDANTVAWLEELQDKISDAVLKALNNTFQANMYVMTGSAEGISYRCSTRIHEARAFGNGAYIRIGTFVGDYPVLLGHDCLPFVRHGGRAVQPGKTIKGIF